MERKVNENEAETKGWVGKERQNEGKGREGKGKKEEKE